MSAVLAFRKLPLRRSVLPRDGLSSGINPTLEYSRQFVDLERRPNHPLSKLSGESSRRLYSASRGSIVRLGSRSVKLSDSAEPQCSAPGLTVTKYLDNS